VLEEEVDAVLLADLRRLADAVDEALPGVGVGSLEGIVVALDPRPDYEVSTERTGELGGSDRRSSASLRTLSSGDERPPRPKTGSRCRPVATQ